jgi:uncharacterized membrane protein YdfJ with MMPL/SSD domain
MKMSTLARVILRRRRAVLALSAIAVLLSVPAASQLQEHLSDAGYRVPGSESARTSAVIEHTRGTRAPLEQLYAILTGQDRAALLARASRDAAALDRDSSVIAVAKPAASASGTTAIVGFEYRGDLDATRRALPRLRALIDASPGTTITGKAAIVDASTKLATKDLSRAERLSLPITLMILVVAFVSVVAAGLPILLALFTLLLTFSALFAVSQLMQTSVFVVNTAVLLGLGLSIDYSLFIVTRYRELRRSLGDEDAIAETLATTGRAIFFSGLTITVCLLGLLVFNVGLFTSMTVGAVLAALIAAGASLIFLPAVLSLLGPRIDRLAIPRLGAAVHQARAWNALARVVVRRPVVVAALATLILLGAAVPLTGLRIGFPSTNELLPNTHEATGAATRRAQRAFGAGALSPFQVVTKAAPGPVAAILAADHGIVAVSAPVPASGGWTELLAVGRSQDNTAQSRATLQRLRRTLHTRFKDTLVGGRTAEGVDLTERVRGRFPLLVIVTAALSLVLLFFAFRSVAVPIKAVLTNLLTVGASLGLTTLWFQHGSDSTQITYFVPVFLFAILFGLSMDYEVFLISRIREEHLAGAGIRAAVTTGMVRSARPITLAALAMITVFASSAISELEPFRQLGVGISLAVLLDATLVRCLLVPAAMVLLGKWNWWAPRTRSRQSPVTR